MNLSIAQFTFGLQLAGQERVVVDLARAFHKAGHRSLVCTTMFGGELEEELASSGIPYHSLSLKKSYDPRAIGPVRRFLKSESVDVVITHGTSGSLIPRIAAILSRVPVFIHVEHNVSDHKETYQIIVNKIISLFTDKIVCISENAQKSLLKIEGTNPDKVVVIPNGLDIERFLKIRNIPKNQERIKKVGIVGRFSEQKGHIYFVDAAAKIAKSIKNIEFIFVGDGPLRPEIEKRVRDYGLETCSSFLGVRSDVGELLQSFDVFVLSSLWEGLPISLLEAQYFGIASVVTNVGGNPEVIIDGHNGLLVPPGDPDALASAVINLLKNDALRDEMGQYAKRLFAAKYSLEIMVAAYINNINIILSAKRLRQYLRKQ